MTNFFSLIYIKTNRFSDEKFCIGILANFNEVPYFGYSISKLNVALNYVNKDMGKAIKRSFGLLENDVNKIIKGEEALSLFDMPYSKKILQKLTLKKRGVVQFSDIIEVKTAPDFEKLYAKFVGEPWLLSKKKTKVDVLPFKKRFYNFVSSNNFLSYTAKYKMQPNKYPLIYTPLTVDLIKKDTHFIAYQTIDFSASLTTIQSTLNKFRLLRQSLNQKAKDEKLAEGKYFLVYESQADKSKIQLIEKIKNNSNGFELILMSEM